MSERGMRVDVRDVGAVGDGRTDDTEALQSAPDRCAETGGAVVVPPGEYMTAPLTVGSETSVELRAGSTITFARDHEAFPAYEGRWEGWEQVGFHPCLLVRDAANVEITGRGTVDGQGDYWWNFYRNPEKRPESLTERLAEFHDRNGKSDDVSRLTHRPPLFQIYESENVSVSGIILRNSPFWNTHVVYSNDVTIHDVRVANPRRAPNGDGIDIDSSQDVRVSDTHVDSGDDAICIKSGKNAEGRDVGRPASAITVTNCTVAGGHGGVAIGSEMSGDVRDVTVSNCTFRDTDRGILVKTARDRGGVVEDLRFDNLVIRRTPSPFTINGYYYLDVDAEPAPVDEGTPMVRNVHFSNVTARNVESAGFLAGLPEQRFENITFSNVEIDATRPLDATGHTPAMADNYDQRHGFVCKSIADLTLRDVTIRTADAPAFAFADTGTVTVDGLRLPSDQGTPIAEAEAVDEILVRGCDEPADPGPFLRILGEGTGRVDFAGNHGDLDDRVAVDEEGRIEL